MPDSVGKTAYSPAAIRQVHAFAHYVFDEPATSLPVITEGVALRYVEEIYPDTLAE